MILVQLMDIELPLLDEIEVCDHDSSNGTHDARVSGQESQQAGRILDDVPRCADDAKNGNDDGRAEDVDVHRAETGDVVAERIRAGGDLVTDGC